MVEDSAVVVEMEVVAEMAEDSVEGMVAEVAGDSAVEDLAAGKEEEMVEDSDDSEEGRGQPKYF